MLGPIRGSMTLARRTGMPGGSLILDSEVSGRRQRPFDRATGTRGPVNGPGETCRRTMTRWPPSGRMAITTMRGQTTKTQIALDAADRRSIAARAHATTHPFSTTGSLPLAELKTSRRSNTRALEMLPPSATLSHGKSMSSKSGNPTRSSTCARNLGLRRGPGQHAQKTHAVYSRMYSRQESPKSRAPINTIAAELSIM